MPGMKPTKSSNIWNTVLVIWGMKILGFTICCCPCMPSRKMTVPFCVFCNASLGRNEKMLPSSSMIPNMPCAFWNILVPKDCFSLFSVFLRQCYVWAGHYERISSSYPGVRRLTRKRTSMRTLLGLNESVIRMSVPSLLPFCRFYRRE